MMIRIAIIGTGGMANSHAKSFKAIRNVKITACCDVLPEKAEAFAEQHGIPAAYADTDKMLKTETLDAATVVTPDMHHCDPVLATLKAGLHTMCEKPLANTLRDAKRMAAAAKKAKRLTTVNFSYRNRPATQKAAKLVASGRLGRIMHVEGNYFQGWLSTRPWHKVPALLWRLSTEHGSAGVLGDLGVHLYDLARFVVGDFGHLASELQTFDKGKKRVGEYVLDANDSVVTTVRFRNGALGMLSTTRWAGPHPNTVALRVYGDKGALDLNLDRPDEEALLGCLGKKAMQNRDWKPVKCPAVPSMYERFARSVRTGKQGQASFDDGAAVQACLDASFRSSQKGGYVKVHRSY